MPERKEEELNHALIYRGMNKKDEEQAVNKKKKLESSIIYNIFNKLVNHICCFTFHFMEGDSSQKRAWQGAWKEGVARGVAREEGFFSCRRRISNPWRRQKYAPKLSAQGAECQTVLRRI